jgi:hypothetical protein
MLPQLLLPPMPIEPEIAMSEVNIAPFENLRWDGSRDYQRE